MGHGHETRMTVWAINVLPPCDRFAQALPDDRRAKMPLLGVLADQQNKLQIRQEREQSLAPQLRTFAARG
jgi:hypothetical protein